jgi:hypothetical protein
LGDAPRQSPRRPQPGADCRYTHTHGPRARGKDRRGDTIKGKYNRSAAGALVERSTLFILLAQMADPGAGAAVAGFSRGWNGWMRKSGFRSL